jgi:hypothetical protein
MTDMHCPNCGIEASTDQKYCRACGLSLPEFSQLLEDKLLTSPEELRVQKRKLERWVLRLWTGAGIIFYIALYWTIISEIIIGKGHVLGGILFLLVITAISLGGLLILYSSALQKRSAYRVSGQPKEKGDTSADLLAGQPSELTSSVTEHTTELLEKEVAKEPPKTALREK